VWNKLLRSSLLWIIGFLLLRPARKNTQGEGVGSMPLLLTHALHWNNKWVMGRDSFLNKLIFWKRARTMIWSIVQNEKVTITGVSGYELWIWLCALKLARIWNPRQLQSAAISNPCPIFFYTQPQSRARKIPSPIPFALSRQNFTFAAI